MSTLPDCCGVIALYALHMLSPSDGGGFLGIGGLGFDDQCVLFRRVPVGECEPRMPETYSGRSGRRKSPGWGMRLFRAMTPGNSNKFLRSFFTSLSH